LTCTDIQAALPAYMDGELDPLRNLEIEQHMQHCAVCSQTYKADQALQTAVKTGAQYYSAPADLRKRIQSSIRQVAKSEPIFPAMPWRWLAVAASVAVVVILAWALSPRLHGLDTEQLVAQEVVSSHVRSLMVDHVADVMSSDQHTVKPWFTGKLDFSPPVKNLAKEGFPLVGGRLDYLDNRAVAALVYQRQNHFINLFIWPSSRDTQVNTKTLARQGYHLLHWTQSGMTYWAVSDLNTTGLQEFVQLVQQQASP
jgi:mycothiol system anti-sigma-R factor